MPPGLELAERLRQPIFTPSTKAAPGSHDENISIADVEKLIGAELARKVKDASLQLYARATEYARERGIIIADTKFEFGLDDRGRATRDGRAADAGFLALLAGGHVRGRCFAAQLR